MPGPALDTLPAKTKNSFQKPDDETDSERSGNAPTSQKTKQNCLTGLEGLQYQKASTFGVYNQIEGTKGASAPS